MRWAGTVEIVMMANWPIFHLHVWPLLAGQRSFQARAGPAGAGGFDGRGRRCAEHRWVGLGDGLLFAVEFGQPGTEEFGGNHGVEDSFLCFDVADEHEESVRYLYTHVRAPRDGRWVLYL